MSNDLPYQLIAWIKREQEEQENHRVKMAFRRMREDSEFITYLKTLVANWGKLSLKEKTIVNGVYEHHRSGRCLTTGQRSAIVALYLKHAS